MGPLEASKIDLEKLNQSGNRSAWAALGSELSLRKRLRLGAAPPVGRLRDYTAPANEVPSDRHGQ